MQNPLLITFHDINHNPEVEHLINEKFEKVRFESPDVTKCHVVVEKQSKHHKKGNEICVRMDLKISHFEDIVVSERCLEATAAIKSAIIAVFKEAIDLAREQKKYRLGQKRAPLGELPIVEPVTADEE
jgi:hypothetical protein